VSAGEEGGQVVLTDTSSPVYHDITLNEAEKAFQVRD
jgi:hypothetical protein